MISAAVFLINFLVLLSLANFNDISEAKTQKRKLLLSSENTRGSGVQPSLYTYSVRNAFPHDPDSFTQGLLYYKDDILYESAGLYGRSTLREVDLTTGRVIRSRPLARMDFAEGLALHDDRLIQLTWRSPKGLLYDRRTFEPLGEFNTGLADGWGVTNEDQSGKELVATDSGSSLLFLDPTTFKVKREVQVHDEGTPINWINELEWIDNEIWANIWQRECIARIDPETGRVKGWVLLQGLKNSLLQENRGIRGQRMDVLNGIAYDKERQRLFVTGKLWPKLFELELRQIEWPPEMDLKNARKLCIVRGNL